MKNFRIRRMLVAGLAAMVMAALTHTAQTAEPQPVEELSAARGRMLLNGPWRFLPARNHQGLTTNGTWGSCWVPGSYKPYAQYPGLKSAGSGPAWSGVAVDALGAAWYRTFVRVPPAWHGRACALELYRVSTAAVVYVNGKLCGTVDWPFGTVDITAAMDASMAADIAILVLSPPAAATRGLIGEVFLHSRPRGPHVEDVFVHTSVRSNTLGAVLELADITGPGTVTVTPRVYDASNQLVATFAPQQLILAGTPAQTNFVAWPWAGYRVWDIGQPVLYTLRLAVQGSGFADDYAQRFGFRELWIVSNDFMLNGTPVRFRIATIPAPGSTEATDGCIDGLARIGYNIAEMWPNNTDVPGEPDWFDFTYERCAVKGLPICAVAPDMNPYLNRTNASVWLSKRATWARTMTAVVRRLRNNPTILMWVTTPNNCANKQDMNPWQVGNRAQLWRNTTNEQCMTNGFDMIRQCDPTRPVFGHEADAPGDMQAVNFYLCMTPLQEREEWFSTWRATGDMPFSAIEAGTPFISTMQRARFAFSAGAANTEPWMTEFCTIYQGNTAYRDEPAAYRARIAERFVSNQAYKSWHGNADMLYATNHQNLQVQFSTATWRSWRTQGLTGGIHPWEYGYGWNPYAVSTETYIGAFKPGRRGLYPPNGYVLRRYLYYLQPQGASIYPAATAISANNQPTLAWLCGPSNAFTAKDHHFYAQSNVVKAVALLNDTRSNLPYGVVWQASVAGTVCASGTAVGVIAPAQTVFAPVAFTASTSAGARTNGILSAIARIGTAAWTDTFAFTVWPARAPASGTCAILDTAGLSSQMLARLGYTLTAWDAGYGNGLVVIGRTALSQLAPAAQSGVLARLAAHIAGGGRALLFAQDPAWFCSNGFRVAAHMPRRAYPVGASPVTTDLTAEELHDWAGASTLLAAHPLDDTQDFPYDSWYPIYGWKWGNRGGLASAALEKPHRAGWRPLLECEFDLAYAPLLELDYGAGRLVLCTLDLEDYYASDPAAAQLAQQLVEYAAHAALAPRATLYCDASATATLAKVGAVFTLTNALAIDAALHVFGPGATLDEAAVSNYVAAGGHVLLLARTGAAQAFGVTLQQVRCAGALDVPATWPEAAGLSASDVRWRSEAQQWLVSGGCEIGAGGQLGRLRLGAGVIIFCQLDPDRFNADVTTYFRFTRWRQTRALAQVLANLGAAFSTDGTFFTASPAAAAYYHADYRAMYDFNSFGMADDPYRFFRW